MTTIATARTGLTSQERPQHFLPAFFAFDIIIAGHPRQSPKVSSQIYRTFEYYQKILIYVSKSTNQFEK